MLAASSKKLQATNSLVEFSQVFSRALRRSDAPVRATRTGISHRYLVDAEWNMYFQPYMFDMLTTGHVYRQKCEVIRWVGWGKVDIFEL